MNLLHIDSSLLGEASISRRLSREIVAAWTACEPGCHVTYRDLAADPPPPLTGHTVAAVRTGVPPTDPAAAAEFARMGVLLDEFLAADAVVIGAPMYNFSIATQLKSWIDALSQAGKTFAYTPQGPRGLAGGKRVVIASSRGNVYGSPPLSGDDFQERYLLAVLRFFGIDGVEVVRAEGVRRGAERQAAALEEARATIRRLFPQAEAAIAA